MQGLQHLQKRTAKPPFSVSRETQIRSRNTLKTKQLETGNTRETVENGGKPWKTLEKASVLPLGLLSPE